MKNRLINNKFANVKFDWTHNGHLKIPVGRPACSKLNLVCVTQNTLNAARIRKKKNSDQLALVIVWCCWKTNKKKENSERMFD